jgi:hypothetical protein
VAVDDLYLHNIVLDSAHQQKAHGLQRVMSIGVANKTQLVLTVFAALMGLAKGFEA